METQEKMNPLPEIDVILDENGYFEGIYMIPPNGQNVKSLYKDPNIRQLRLRNTGDIIVLDRKDWENVKGIEWNLDGQGRIVNKRGLTLEEYLGIHGIRRIGEVSEFNYTRKAYYNV